MFNFTLHLTWFPSQWLQDWIALIWARCMMYQRNLLFGKMNSDHIHKYEARKGSSLIIFWWCSFTLGYIYLSGFRNEQLSSVLWRLRFVYNSTDSETLNIQHHINDILTIRVGCLRTPRKSWVMLGYNCHDSSYFCYIKLYWCKYGNTEATGSCPCVCLRQQNNKGEQFKTCYISERVSNAYNLIL